MDPLATQYLQWSAYHYAANNPISITDPTGMEWSETNKELADRFGIFGGGSGSGNYDDWKPSVNSKGNVTYTSENRDSYDTFVEQYGEEAANEVFGSNCGDGCFDKNAIFDEGEANFSSSNLHKLLVTPNTGDETIINQIFAALRFENMNREDFTMDWKLYISSFSNGADNGMMGLVTTPGEWIEYSIGNSLTIPTWVDFRGGHDGLITTIPDGRVGYYTVT